MISEKKTLKEVADFSLGKMLDKKKNKGDLRSYLANVNVRWGKFEFDKLREMRFEQHELIKFGLKYGDIVMCEGGEPGRCAIWKNQVPGMMIQKALHRIRPHECLNNHFLYYTFLEYAQTGQFSPFFTGATIKHLPREKLAQLEIEIPPLPTQRKIASILSVYDDLIENNTRRIAILEEMAQATYREWFVNFRFPGFESFKLVDSPLGQIPEGWEVVTIADIALTTDYVANGSFASLKQNVNLFSDENYALFVRTTDNNKGWNGDYRYVNEDSYRFLRRSVLKGKEFIISNVGDVGTVFRPPYWLKKPMTLGSNCVLVRSDTFDEFLFYFLRSALGQNLINGITSGAAQGKFNKTSFRALKIFTPPMGLNQKFTEFIKPIWTQKDIFEGKKNALKCSRDLLLPNLISGKLDVEDLDIDAGMTAEVLEAATV